MDTVTSLTCCDVLYVGGGNARKLILKVPAHVRIVSNTAGITGGIRLWETELDELFQGVAMAQAGEPARQT
jgi:polyphosphate glucokinase